MKEFLITMTIGLFGFFGFVYFLLHGYPNDSIVFLMMGLAAGWVVITGIQVQKNGR